MYNVPRSPIFVTSMAVGKAADGLPVPRTAASGEPNVILVGDLWGSVSVLSYKVQADGLRNLGCDGQDLGHADVLACEAFTDGQVLGYVAADRGGALRTYRQGRAGLLVSGALQLDQLVKCIRRIRAGRAHIPIVAAGGGQVAALVPATADGGSESRQDQETRFRALQTLQRKLAEGRHLPAPLGLNPRAFRSRFFEVPRGLGGAKPWLVQASQRKPASPESILDLQYLAKLLDLPLDAQARVCEEAGIPRSQALQAISALQRAVTL